MSKTLEERLRDAKTALGKVDASTLNHAGKLAPEVEKQFKAIAAFTSDIEHWIGMLAARSAARSLLTGLEAQANANDDVPFGIAHAKYQHVRLIGVQAYLATKWALADRLVGMAGHVLCVRSSLQDPKNLPQLVSHFIANKGPESKIAAVAFYSLRHSFGWPIAVSYALRNHFVHDGGQLAGTDFFDGPTAASGFKIFSFGPDYKSDFFFFSKSSDDWNAVFIELEKPWSRFFKGNSDEFHSDFLRALQQINQWKAWFLSEQNKAGFLSMVGAIQVPRHMARNPTFNKYVLVFGRRSEYAGNENRRRLVAANETTDFKIITFDSLAEDLESKHEVSIGSRHNQFIDILTDKLITASLYSWVEPTLLRVSRVLHDRLKNGPRSNHFVMAEDGNRVEALTRAAPLVRVRAD